MKIGNQEITEHQLKRLPAPVRALLDSIRGDVDALTSRLLITSQRPTTESRIVVDPDSSAPYALPNGATIAFRVAGDQVVEVKLDGKVLSIRGGNRLLVEPLTRNIINVHAREV